MPNLISLCQTAIRQQQSSDYQLFNQYSEPNKSLNVRQITVHNRTKFSDNEHFLSYVVLLNLVLASALICNFLDHR